MLIDYLAAFTILYVLLLMHDYATDSREEGGWLRALALSVVWVGAVFIVQQVGTIAWLVAFPLLVVALKGIMGYSTSGAFLFIIFISVIFHGILTVGLLQ